MGTSPPLGSSLAGDGSRSLVGRGQYAGGAGVCTVKIVAKLDTAGNVSGTLRVDSVLLGRTCTTYD